MIVPWLDYIISSQDTYMYNIEANCRSFSQQVWCLKPGEKWQCRDCRNWEVQQSEATGSAFSDWEHFLALKITDWWLQPVCSSFPRWAKVGQWTTACPDQRGRFCRFSQSLSMTNITHPKPPLCPTANGFYIKKFLVSIPGNRRCWREEGQLCGALGTQSFLGQCLKLMTNGKARWDPSVNFVVLFCSILISLRDESTKCNPMPVNLAFYWRKKIATSRSMRSSSPRTFFWWFFCGCFRSCSTFSWMWPSDQFLSGLVIGPRDDSLYWRLCRSQGRNPKRLRWRGTCKAQTTQVLEGWEFVGV